MTATPQPPRPPKIRRGTVLSVENVPATPGAHPAGPPPYYRWRQRTAEPDEELRRVHAICASMGVSIIEAITGQRPVRQLMRWCEPEIIRKLHQRSLLEGTGSAPPNRTMVQHRPYRTPEIRPRRVRAIHVATEEYEATVIIEQAGRCRALALRLHRPRGQWRIVSLEIG